MAATWRSFDSRQKQADPAPSEELQDQLGGDRIGAAHFEGYVDRVLTLNFDLVLENACGLLALQPAVYDFGVAPADDPGLIVSPAIVHLHGQSYGLVRLNTDEETRRTGQSSSRFWWIR